MTTRKKCRIFTGRGESYRGDKHNRHPPFDYVYGYPGRCFQCGKPVYNEFVFGHLCDDCDVLRRKIEEYDQKRGKQNRIFAGRRL